MNPIIQLFEPESSTYTYVVYDAATLEAIIIDPVDCMLQRDMQTLASLKLTLKYIVETHTHADHITSAAALAEHTGAQIATPAGCGAQAAVQLEGGDVLTVGSLRLKALHTPGHTAGSMSYWLEGLTQPHVFTGDTLLINGCGRTDFQSGSAQALYHSITQVLFALPPQTTVWPGHDYKGNTHSTIGEQRSSNPRLVHEGQLRSELDFMTLMNGLQLPRPKRMHEAVPANLSLGIQPPQHASDDNALSIKHADGYAGDVLPELAWQWVQSGEAVLIDVRSDAERAWVGFVPDAKVAAWKLWPGMTENPGFDAQLRAGAGDMKRVVLLCRSGLRSIPAAKRATALGFEAYNILEGFEGDPNPHAHRNSIGGWRIRGLPWKQN
jgi:glyoxylase-like metal-dependent hydrolase (beta-lactamase superfamily II)/rhodanese-related sulfurtransferase